MGKRGNLPMFSKKIVTFDNSMLSILKANDPPAGKGQAFRMGALYMKKHHKKRCVAMFHAAFFV